MQLPRVFRLSFPAHPGRLVLLTTVLGVSLYCARGQVAAPPPGTGGASQSNPDEVQTAQVVKQNANDSKRDVAISAFAQTSPVKNGNFIRQTTSASGGGMVSFRQSPRWWAGYELNYGYTKYGESYQSRDYIIQHNANEITAAYLIKHTIYGGVTGFLSLGAGAMIFSPSSYGGPILLTPGTPTTQSLPLFVFSVGVEKNIGEHFGVRVQYRDDRYKTPNFKQPSLDTHTLRSTTEPAAGVYYRF